MKVFTVSQVLKATDGKLLCGNEKLELTDVTKDSRNVPNGSLFVPIRGENFDGHNFINSAFENGAAATLTEDDRIYKSNGGAVILVKNTIAALQGVAKMYRNMFDIPFVALTGSVGKTTTKEMVACVLESKYNTLKTQGNLNNEIGVPFTVFGLCEKNEAAVIEMGMSGFGEIDRLAGIVSPDMGVFTNIGISHIELLGSQENIYKAKSEMLRHIKPNGKIFINGDDKILWLHRNDMGKQVLAAGIENTECDYTAKNIVSSSDGVSFTVDGGGKSLDITLNVPGIHNVYNAMFAVMTGRIMGIADENIKNALNNYVPIKMRMNIIKKNGYTVIDDCYNAAPDSMKAALKVLAGFEGGRKIAILGDILCMGDFSKEAHSIVGEAVAKEKTDLLFTVGTDAKYIAQSAEINGMKSENIHCFDTAEELLMQLSRYIRDNDYILVKASRGMKLERVADYLTKEQ